jgi:thiamine phosphate synthase YjbQ (UPF0047 family)
LDECVADCKPGLYRRRDERTATPVLAAEPDDGILSDILETFNEPYSPNNPGYSHNVDWMEFLDFELV